MSESEVKKELRTILEDLKNHTPLYHITDEEAAEFLGAVEQLINMVLDKYEHRRDTAPMCKICKVNKAAYSNVRHCKRCHALYNQKLYEIQKLNHLRHMEDWEREGR